MKLHCWEWQNAVHTDLPSQEDAGTLPRENGNNTEEPLMDEKNHANHHDAEGLTDAFMDSRRYPLRERRFELEVPILHASKLG
jgi:hypothetical protein